MTPISKVFYYRLLPHAPSFSSIFAISIGYLVLIGYSGHLDLLKQVWPGFVSMNPVTAVCFIILGSSFLIKSLSHRKLHLGIADALAIVTLVIAVFKILSLFILTDLHIDQVIFGSDLYDAVYAGANKMAPHTAVSFSLLSLAVLVLRSSSKISKNILQLSCAITIGIGLLSLEAYILGVNHYFWIPQFIPMALHTAMGFLFLGVGIVIARKDINITKILTSDTSSGIGMRIIMPAALLIPITLNWLLVQGINRNLYDAQFGIAATTMLTTLIIWVIVWQTNKKAFEIDIEEIHTEQRLEEQKITIEKKVVERTKELREERARLLASIDSLRVGFILTDHNSKPLMVNSSTRRIAYQNSGPIKDTSSYGVHFDLSDLDHILKINLEESIKKCIQDQKPIDFKEVSHEEKFLHIYIAPVVLTGEKMEIIGAVVLLEDITEAKNLERSKDEFFSIASHELRTPLTAIRGNASLIQQIYADKMPDQDFREMIADTKEASERLIMIVNDFLNVGRLEQGRMTYVKEIFDPLELADEVMAELKPSIPTNSKIEFQLDKSSQLPPVLADKGKTKEVLINLIGNSIKFTELGFIKVRFEDLDEFIKIYVQDSGRGIAKDRQTLLFRKFQQAGDSLITRDTTKSTGLGLYISKLMVEGMGGQIKLEKSDLGQGSSFSFSLPTAQSAAQEIRPEVKRVI